MKCPHCRAEKHTVIWSRPGMLNTTKRRRLCAACECRWTTTEIVDRSSVVREVGPEFTDRKPAERRVA